MEQYYQPTIGMNSIAGHITSFPGSSSLSTQVKANYLSGSYDSPGGALYSLSRSTSLTSLDSQSSLDSISSGVIRGGVPSQNGFSASTQTNPSFLHDVYKPGSNKMNSVASQTTANSQSSVGPQSWNPLGVISDINNKVTSGLVGANTAVSNSVNSINTAHNLSQHGVGLLPAISTIQQNANNLRDFGNAGAVLGSVLGPVGAIAGGAIGESIGVGFQADLPTISSFRGQVSPDNSGIANSHSTMSSDNQTILSQ